MGISTKKTILLVEDEVFFAKTLFKKMERFGYEILLAHSGEEAVEKFHQNIEIHLVLMDIELGNGMDGTKTAQEILAIKNIPIIFHTFHIQQEIVERVKSITRYGYIIKNSGDFVLQSSIEMALELFEAHQETKSKYAAIEAFNELSSHTSAILNRITDSVISLDKDLKFTYVNDSVLINLRKSREELIGYYIWDIFPEAIGTLIWEKIQDSFKSQVVHEFESFYEPYELWIQIRSYPSHDGLTILYQDITKRKLAEEKVKSLLDEKELLLKEVHHRIKNNMLTITGLLFLQKENLTDMAAINALDDASSRIQSMIVLYDKLYRSTDFNELPIPTYLPPLIEEIIGVFPNHKNIEIKKEVDDFILPSSILFPLGIIINEILTNAMKYAFAGRDSGRLVIVARKKDHLILFSIEDNGIGLPESISLTNTSGFGLQLVQMLAKQVRGNIYIERNNGTKFTLEFRLV